MKSLIKMPRKHYGSTSAWIFSTETIFLTNFERILKYQKDWTIYSALFPLFIGEKEGGGCRPARPGELGCFHQKAPPSVGTLWKAQVGLIAICTPLLLNTPPLCFFLLIHFQNVMELYGLRNDTHFLSGMLWNFTDYATMPFLTSRMLQNFTDCAKMPFLTSRMWRNFIDYLTMGVKYLKTVKRRLHATKKWSPDEIRLWQLPLFTYLLLEIKAK